MTKRDYPEYINSGIKWFGNIPNHWNIHKLKHIATTNFSNVDKHTIDGEEPVQLCNYTDVYYNDSINSDLEFMNATATISEIIKYSLRAGDVIITKDSESWDDIAIPAYVESDIQGVLCGYHLAQIRPNPDLVYGKYLFRSFCSRGINDQFRVAATGITRYGLGKYWLDNGLFLIPPIEEQCIISDYLERETSRIDSLIEKKQRQIVLLQEKRSALISHAVTKGLNPDVKMKDSGIEWFGHTPERWLIAKLKRYSSIIDGDRGTEYPNENDLIDEGIPFLSSKNIVGNEIHYSNLRFISVDKFNKLGRGKLRKGDVVVTVRGTIGSAGHFKGDVFETGFINAQMMILRSRKRIYSSYLHYVTRSSYWLSQLRFNSYGTAQQQLSNDILSNIVISIPPLNEQVIICKYLDLETARINNLISKIRLSVDKLFEYRSALISAAVTGKIDVREEVA